MTQYSSEEKLEVMEFLIEQWRSAGRHGSAHDRATYLILKAIASDYRARDKIRISETINRMERAIDHAKLRKQPVIGYEPGNLRERVPLALARPHDHFLGPRFDVARLRAAAGRRRDAAVLRPHAVVRVAFLPPMARLLSRRLRAPTCDLPSRSCW